MTYVHGKFVWFEHFSDDVPKARAFYEALFGWKTDPVAMGTQMYPLIENAGAGIGGFRAAPPDTRSQWMSYLSVPEVDAATKAAQEAGAKVILPPTDFAPVGRGATVADPTGAIFSVWRGADADPADSETIPPGAWYWTECWTPDRDMALLFYEKVFGFTHETTTSTQGPYYVLMTDGIARGGIMQATQPGPPAGWTPYVAVEDCDATAKRATELGARIGLPPTDIPDVGRIAVFMDTSGAMIGIVEATRAG